MANGDYCELIRNNYPDLCAVPVKQNGSISLNLLIGFLLPLFLCSLYSFMTESLELYSESKCSMLFAVGARKGTISHPKLPISNCAQLDLELFRSMFRPEQFVDSS